MTSLQCGGVLENIPVLNSSSTLIEAKFDDFEMSLGSIQHSQNEDGDKADKKPPGRMLPTDITYENSAVPGLRVQVIRDYAYTHVCYPRCRKWRCEKYCEKITLWSTTKRKCEALNPACGKTCTF